MKQAAAACALALVSGQAVCICGCEQAQRVAFSSPATFGKITALEAAEQELWKRCA